MIFKYEMINKIKSNIVQNEFNREFSELLKNPKAFIFNIISKK